MNAFKMLAGLLLGALAGQAIGSEFHWAENPRFEESNQPSYVGRFVRIKYSDDRPSFLGQVRQQSEEGLTIVDTGSNCISVSWSEISEIEVVGG